MMLCLSGYLFSQEIIATMDKYKNEVAETVIDKAKKLCQDLQDVSSFFFPFLFYLFEL